MMCLLFVARDQDPEYPLIMLFNRDEGFRKKTKTLHWWDDHLDRSGSGVRICGGRDLDKGGTWSGVTDTGRIAMITFVRKTREQITPSIGRGELVPRWLSSDYSVSEFAEILRSEAKFTLGYNLVFGDFQEQFHFDNHSGKLTQLTSRFHGVSNAYLDTPWFKVEKGRYAVEYSLQNQAFFSNQTIEGLEQNLFTIMEDDTKAEPDQVQDTGLDYFKEEEKSSIFVRAEDYGTISSTVLTVRNDGLIRISERSYDSRGKRSFSATEQFRI